MTTTFVGIDPSTNTGVVRLDYNGNVLDEKLITSEYTIEQDVKRLVDISYQVSSFLIPTDLICIESPSYASKGQYALQQGALAFMLRAAIEEKSLTYIDVAPSQLKKFVTGSHLCKKEGFILPLYKLYGYENNDDNIRDAYGLAQIARSVRTGIYLNAKQREVMEKVLKDDKPKR